MNAIFHGVLADHYTDMLKKVKNREHLNHVTQSLDYHEKQYKKLNDHVSGKNLFPPVQDRDVCGVSKEPVQAKTLISSRFWF